MSNHPFEPGERVRVRGDCPHTLPAYARMLTGVVQGADQEGLITVDFGQDRIFPVDPKWLERVEPGSV
jgi:hypothetical protein